MTSRPKLLIATTNPHKARELAALLGDIPYDVMSLRDVGIDLDVEETGTTFEENARLKATTYADLSGLLALADDSGLEVDALNGEPGVYSNRYAGPGASDEDKVQLVLRKLDGIPEDQRQGRFRCVIAVAEPKGAVEVHHGTVEGRIGYDPRGSNGFGYDPIFVLPDRGLTTAELSPEEKNQVSHRGRAARAAAEALRARAASGR